MANPKTFDLIAEQLQGVRQAPDPFQRQHIFHSILAYCGQQENAAGRMDMMYRFSECQRALGNMLRGNLMLANDLIGAIDRTPLALSSTAARSAMDAIHAAMVAYKHYALRDYAAAHALLDRGRAAFGALFEDGFPRAALALIDLELNAIRVDVAAGQTARAVARAVETLQLLYRGHGRLARFDIDWSATLSQAESASISHFFTDALLSKLIGTDEREHIQALFAGLCADTADWERSDLRVAFGHYERLLNGRSSDALDREFVAGGALAGLPSSLQYLIVFAMLAGAPHATSPAAMADIRRYFDDRPEIGKLRLCAWCDERTLSAGQGGTDHAAPGIPALA